LKLSCGLEADGTLVETGPPRSHHSVTPSIALFFLFVVIARGAFLQLLVLFFLSIFRVGYCLYNGPPSVPKRLNAL
jgi:hypothetical protein